LMIFRGRNVYPQDIEATAIHCHPRLAAARAAAFAVAADGEERLVLVQELARPGVTDEELGQIAAAIRANVSERHQLRLHDLLIVPPRKIPVTSSGKVRRRACREQYLGANFARLSPGRALRPRPAPRRGRTWDRQSGSPARTFRRPETKAGGRSPEQVEIRIREIIARQACCPVDEVDPSLPFGAHGLDSVQAVTLAGELSDWLGAELSPTFVWEHASIEQAVGSLTGTAAVPLTVPPGVGRRAGGGGGCWVSFSWVVWGGGSTRPTLIGRGSLDGRADS
jgi:acyl carrier protein